MKVQTDSAFPSGLFMVSGLKQGKKALKIRMAGESNDEFADAIARILLGKEDLEKLGIAKRAFAEKEVDWKVMADRLFDFYRLSC